MPSAMLATALGDPAYHAALAKVGDKGFKATDTVQYEGKTYTHDDIAAMFDDAYQRLRPQYCVMMGGKPRVIRHREAQFRRAVKDDVFTKFNISWWTVAMAAVMLILAGPLGLVIAICAALFEYYFIKDWEGDKAMLSAMGAE